MGRRSCPTCGASARGGTYCALCGTYLASPDPRRRRFETAREYVRYAAKSARSWSGAGVELRRLRRDLRRLERARAWLVYELGAAVYAEDEQARDAILDSLRASDGSLQEKQAEMAQVIERVEHHVRGEKLSERPTEVSSAQPDEDRATAQR
jgi:hypothetical protein